MFWTSPINVVNIESIADNVTNTSIIRYTPSLVRKKIAIKNLLISINYKYFLLFWGEKENVTA